MIKESYTRNFYSANSKYINNVLALRSPQHESLEIFARLCDTLSLAKNPTTTEQIRSAHQTELGTLNTKDKRTKKKITKWAAESAAEFYADDLVAARALCPTLTSFERDFPSFCFALATGIGKTRLMGACIAYLRYEKGIKNFFVMAPNLTIYRKLKDELGNPSSPKYIFRGLDKFVNPPRIIDGDNYNSFRQGAFAINDVIINLFNIAKLNSDSKVSSGSPARIKRLNEVLGESYFSYLQSLDDLCIFMDESHHYHADKSFEVINELRPILGVELTATPKIQKGASKIDFKNVAYEYPLAQALNDGKYVKVPVIFTRKNFRPEEYTPEQLDWEKLNDGVRLHEETKSRLEIYARNSGKPVVKPFILVVAKDTDHSKKIREYITSDDFFRGYYKDKVIEINSSQRGAEKDENIEQLLSLEKPDNKIEIVIHVNMLKEGWDVTNLYTIVPLRASASEILTEQTIGRGLRLPYGERTGVDEVDRLSIVSHDKYEAIVNLANDPNSLVRRVHYIDPAEAITSNEQRVTIEMPTIYDELTSDNYIEQLDLMLIQESIAQHGADSSLIREQATQVVSFMAKSTSRSVMELHRQVPTFDAINDSKTRQLVQNSVISKTIDQFPTMNLSREDLEVVVQKRVDTCVKVLMDKVIPIPQAIVQPFKEVKQKFYKFKLVTSSMNWHPSEDTMIGTELQEGGRTFDYESDFYARDVVDTPENEIVRHIVSKDDVDYHVTSDLLYSLVEDAKQHFLSYLTEEETLKVMRERQKTIANIIYEQMQQHCFLDETHFRASEMRPFSRIETSFGSKFRSDEIYDLRANIPVSEVRRKIFNGFKKACHTLYKFDSNTERNFAIVLENDKDVLKWMRPSPKQFNIYYGLGSGSKYEPDFIVETRDKIYMVEIKASNEMDSASVKEKAAAAVVYCKAVSDWNATHGGKPWEYALISHDEVRPNFSFSHLMKHHASYPQMGLEDLKGH